MQSQSTLQYLGDNGWHYNVDRDHNTGLHYSFPEVRGFFKSHDRIWETRAWV